MPSKLPIDAAQASDHAGLVHADDDIFFAAVKTTRMPMIVTDPRQPDNPIIFANPAFLEMTGYTAEDLLGSNCRFLQGADTNPDTVTEVRRAIAERRNVAVEILNYRKDGSAFWNALFVSPVYGKSGELLYFFGSQLDVSRRRDAEDALRQGQRMEALGQLTGGIAHDFNNLLQVIVGYLDVVENRVRDAKDPRLDRALGNMRTAADRATTLTQQLLAFARKQRLDARPVNFNNMIETLTDLARRTLGEPVEIATQLAADLKNCRVDQTQAEVALLNIFINARDAMPDGGSLVIETENRVIAEEDVAVFSLPKPGAYVCVSVTDTGCGMAPDVMSKVMEPFFTTKDEGKGTGLGLSMVYGFVRQTGGGMRLYSEVGHGTTVRLFFPATEQIAEPERAPPPMAMDRAGGESVLLVEDRDDVSELARSILEDFGYEVHSARNGREALELIDGGPRFDLLFSDLIMPGGMNGVVLAREARRRQPKLKVLLTTGYAEASLERLDVGGPEFEIINKPYRRSDLARRVRMILDGPTGVS